MRMRMTLINIRAHHGTTGGRVAVAPAAGSDGRARGPRRGPARRPASRPPLPETRGSPMGRRFPTTTLLPTLAGLTLFSSAASGETPPATSAEQRLEERVGRLESELAEVKAELAHLKAAREGAPAASVAAAPAAASPAPAAPALATTSTAAGASPLERLSLWGYGEAYLTHPVHVPKESQADLARAVFGIGYQFDERTSFNSEFEVEHAVSSASDVGEFEVEQFFVEHQVAPWGTVRAGLFLMPFGLLNERS